MNKRLTRILTSLGFLCLSGWLFDIKSPISLKPLTQTQLIVAEDGTPLRAFADTQGIWRYPIDLNQVSPLYIQALLTYEDQWFWSHPGINPFALTRALLQNIRSQHIISGGSTLTMQVVRLIDPQPKTLSGKFIQILRALQLEWHYSKRDILQYYLNYAPFGGTLQGVQAASYSYLHKSATELSYAEAALLAVLPQAPSRYRPDRHPKLAQLARDKVLRRLATQHVWSEMVVKEALMEQVSSQRQLSPLIAPLLAQRFKGLKTSGQILQTTIQPNLQRSLEELVKTYMRGLPPQTSAAVLVVENRSLTVKAYLGSADFGDKTRFAHIDMIRAIRSPGSTLKPFLYALALDEGLIHSQSLLVDAPTMFEGYRPHNFDRGFSGPVSVSYALTQSLNVPAIQVLSHLGSAKLMNRLQNAGLLLRFGAGVKPNLSMILGGVGTTLESLVGTYTALANHGVAGKVRFFQHSPIESRYLMSAGSAWIVRQILKHDHQQAQALAWKTGTSYGYRDFWSIGVNTDYTIGVWIGRPDATPTPGHYGARTAAPLLFQIAERLSHYAVRHSQPQTLPDSVTEAEICWPLGGLVSETPTIWCHEKRQAWLLNHTVPKTLSSGENSWEINPLTIQVHPQTGKLVDETCAVEQPLTKQIALWPLAVEPWIPNYHHRRVQMGDYDASCAHPPQLQHSVLTIEGLTHHAQLRTAGASQYLPTVTLKVSGAQGRIYWFINGQLIYQIAGDQIIKHHFNDSGHYQIAVSDDLGKTASIEIDIIAP